jgi:hypothetical protein
MATFTDEQLASRAFTRVARILFEQREEFRGFDTRLFDWLIDDRFTYIGRSIRGDDYREHVVPRAVIRDICIDLFEGGRSIEDAAEVIRATLNVARITRQQARRLDEELGLESCMPQGWDYKSGDYLARLRAGGVELVGV